MVAVAVLGLAGSGAIAQGVTFGGSAGMGVIYHGSTKTADGKYTDMESMIEWRSDFDISMTASGTTDGGLTFGASAAIEAGEGKDESTVTDSEVFIAGESWQIKIGALDPASDKGLSLGDVGYAGLGVDDVAEHIGGTKANVEVSFSLGAASLAITAGQMPGNARTLKTAAVIGVDPDPMMDQPDTIHLYTMKRTAEYSAVQSESRMNFVSFTGTDIAPYHMGDDNPETADVDESFQFNIYYHTVTEAQAGNAPFDNHAAGDVVYIRQKGPKRDENPGVETSEDPETEAIEADEADDVLSANDLGLTTEERLYTETIPGAKKGSTVAAVEAADAVWDEATSQRTQWAAGVSFDVGGTTLGIGMDSEKLMQASISADLGSFSGKLYYSRKNMDDDMKSTGTGVEIGVSAGENTSINTVYAQGKTGDDTSKGFGVGVSHSLGGGATLAAGFAKVEDQTKASVGVTMSF